MKTGVISMGVCYPGYPCKKLLYKLHFTMYTS